MDYEKDVKIDEFHLDQEFIKQPSLLMYYLSELSDLDQEVNDLKDLIAFRKDEYKSDRAKKDLEYRTGKIDPGCKITEGLLSSLLDSDESLNEKLKDIFDLRKKLNSKTAKRDIFSGAVDSLKHKKSSLENLSTREVAGFFSTPKEKPISNTDVRKLARKQI
jgi:hypothetical protein